MNARCNPRFKRSAIAFSESGALESSGISTSRMCCDIRLSPPYNPVGVCIYCGKTPKRLTKEHIVPYGIGGNLILPKSSCEHCADMTKRFEQTVQRGMLWPFRYRINAPTRHPKDRPTHFNVETVRHDGYKEMVRVPAGDHPTALVLIRLQRPNILRGLPPVKDFPGDLWHASNTEEVQRLINKHGARGMRIGSFNVTPFARMLAKIGYAYAVAEKGYGTFNPTIIDVINNKTETPSYWVGGEMEIPPPEDVLHNLKLGEALFGGKKFLIVTIRLFAHWGTPIYHTVLGEL